MLKKAVMEELEDKHSLCLEMHHIERDVNLEDLFQMQLAPFAYMLKWDSTKWVRNSCKDIEGLLTGGSMLSDGLMLSWI